MKVLTDLIKTIVLGRNEAGMESPLDGGIYQTCRPGPSALIGSDGHYQSGWYDSFAGRFNLEESVPEAGNLNSWLHVTFDSPRYFVGCHLAHLRLAGHVSVLLVDKEREDSDGRSRRSYFVLNRMQVDPTFSTFYDPRTNSHISMTMDGGVDFNVQVEGLQLMGRARPLFEKPLVQITGYPGGKGTLQWWGNLELTRGQIIQDGLRIPLEPGIPGSYDRTLGHRRHTQNWNWLSSVGNATHTATGEVIPMALQMSKDRPKAKPVLDARKFCLWLNGDLKKFSTLSVDYAYKNEEDRSTDSWIWRAEGVHPEDRMVLTFEPRFQRREQGRIPRVYEADFNQYYGDLSGEIWFDGEHYTLDKQFSLTEDSYLVL